MKYLLLLCLAWVFISCENHKIINESYPDTSFNSLRWKADSTGCLRYREEVYLSMRAKEKFFTGKSYSFLINLLGNPSFSTRKNNTPYTIGYVVTCTEIPALKNNDSNKNKKLYDISDATTLDFRIIRDTCISVNTAVP